MTGRSQLAVVPGDRRIHNENGRKRAIMTDPGRHKIRIHGLFASALERPRVRPAVSLPGTMSRAFFDQVVEALVGFLPSERQAFSSRVTGRNLKVWFGTEPREHYEVQILRRDGAPVLEVGFHAEHPDAAHNREVLDRLRAGERRWRRTLGPDAETGPFLGRTGWSRVSETWGGVDLADPGAAVEAADRLAEYIDALEPLRAGDA